MLLENYFPVLLFILVGSGVGLAAITLGNFVAPNNPDSEKLSPYECGFEAFEDARMKFDVRYYLVAILFILFDLETAFLFPWAVSLQDLGLYGVPDDGGVRRRIPGRLLVHLEEGRAGMGVIRSVRPSCRTNARRPS